MRLINETAYQDKLAKIPMGERFFAKAVEIAQHMPTIDAVEVIRCKDCRFLGGENLGLHDCDHYRGPMRVELDDFCSYGERKETT